MSASVTYTDTTNMFADTSKITLDKINQGINGTSGGGGGGGTGGITPQQVYFNRNPTPPINPAYDAISFDSNGVITNWVGGGSAWT